MAPLSIDYMCLIWAKVCGISHTCRTKVGQVDIVDLHLADICIFRAYIQILLGKPVMAII